jgi:hypothetical protein
MLELLRAAMKGGFRTSEFWLSALAVVLPLADTAASNAHGTVGIIASAGVAAAYAVSRGYVKGKAASAVSTAAASEVADSIVQARTAGAQP